MATPDKGEVWGILGGAFDPVHLGHIRLALDLKNKKNLDGVVLIPSFLHPFKKYNTIASFDDRVEMLKLAAESTNCFSISTIERDNNLPGYTLDTVLAVKNMYPDTTFYFLIGADNITQVHTWHEPDKIFKEIKVIAGTRPNHSPDELENKFSENISYIETGEYDIASSDIRSALKEANYDYISDMVDPVVLEYIKKRKLYL